jgi:hypothetical protein
METNALPGTDAINLPAGIYTLTIPGINEDVALSWTLSMARD